MKLPVHIPPPRFMFIELNKACNLRCEHCDFWKLEDNFAQFISLDTIEAMVVELAELNPEATVVTCGGEPMLNYERYIDFCSRVKLHGLKCFSVSNGTFIRNVERARDIVTNGPSEISISIDSPYPDKHDEWRGVKNSWIRSIKALRLLVEARKWSSKHGGPQPKIHAMTIVSERSYRDLPAYFELMLNDIGVDKAKLNIVQPTFGGGRNGDYFYDRNVVKDVEDFRRVVSECNSRFSLNLNPLWFKQVGDYFNDIQRNQNSLAGWSTQQGTAEHICNTHDRNIMVDTDGNARLCFSSIFPSRSLVQELPEGRFFQPGALRNLWYKDAEEWRDDMRGCNRYCGISHSVRREHATLKSERQPRW